MGDADRAKDMVQEAWMEILKSLGRLDDVAAFPAWAYRIVTRRCQRAFHALDQILLSSEDHDSEQIQWVTEDLSVESTAELSIVVQAIGRLPASQRVAIALFYLEELSVAEIAIATDVPPGTVKTRLMHARRKLRAILEGEDS
jgi:RNA polymerase sigma factor (sigma-70 family)